VKTAVSALFISTDDSTTNISNSACAPLQNEAKVSTATAIVVDENIA